jgi:tryptophanyl-tRNA synthetase
MTVIFSGIQPTGRKHLGNFIGAIEQYVDGQDRGDPAIYCVVDLHALTVEYDPPKLRSMVYDTTAILLAAGLSPEQCILFRQSDVHEHTELAWMLSCLTELGRLDRMHQFRDKSTNRQLVSAGLLFYPVLQAADVLAYRADEVPVGEDQREHIELMRDVAKRFNSRFGDTLVVPEIRVPKIGARIGDLQQPERKMSTTAASEAGTVYVLEEPDAIVKKFKRAVTDSGADIVHDRANKPGVSNLLEIYAAVRRVSIPEAEAAFADARGYGDLKTGVAEAVVERLTPVRERALELRADEAALEAALAVGAEKARAIASRTLADVRECMRVGPA